MTVPVSTTAETRDDRLARLLSELSESARKGQKADIDGLARDHPDLAVELRELWAAAQFAAEFVGGGSRSSRDSGEGPTYSSLGSRGGRLAGAGRRTPPAVSRLSGRTFGDFELYEEIGRGGMGVVYKAWQKSLNRLVALKMILRGEQATPADLARFQVEAHATARLEHPNIVPVYAAGEHDSQAYFCMRLVEGETLSTRLAHGPMRPREAAELLAVISRAVDFAHRQGILHRDLKPSNILIDLDNQPHVTDFGLAKRVHTAAAGPHGGADAPPGGAGLTQSGGIVGTPAYMAPEQVTVRRGKPSPASDVYSLGVILYEMITGRPPFQAPTPVDTLLLVLDQDPIRPGMLNPKVDPDLELICLKCIQKAPELRYRSAADLAADLEAYLHGDQLSIRTTRLVDLGNFFGRLLRETHHAVVLENWGVLWMCHALKISLQCVLTTVLAWNGIRHPAVFLFLWGGGLIAWGAVFWNLRKRAGPVLFIERQVAHVWAAAVMATISVFILEMLLGLDVLSLAPMLAVIAGMTFVVKAGMLSGTFYLYAAAQFLIVVPMALYPDYGVLLFGVVTAVSFFVPGLKYYRQRLRSRRLEAA